MPHEPPKRRRWMGRGWRGAGRRSCVPRRWSQSCETNPICPMSTRRGTGRQWPQVLPLGDKRAKQTQFVPSLCEGQVPCGKGVMSNWGSKGPRKNKANLHRSVKWQVAGVKWERPASSLATSDFTVPTSAEPLTAALRTRGTPRSVRAKQSQIPRTDRRTGQCQVLHAPAQAFSMLGNTGVAGDSRV